MPSERTRVLQAGHIVEDGRVDGIIAISRAIGDWEYKSPSLEPQKMAVTSYPEVRSYELNPQLDFVITACDGIWDCLTSEECVTQTRQSLSQLREEQPISSVIEAMFDRIIATDILSSAGVGTDNMTCVIV